MPDSIHPSGALADSKTYPLGENNEYATALVALSHRRVEQLLYSAMLSGHKEITFTARSLMALTGIRSLSTVRRGLEGLLVKLRPVLWKPGATRPPVFYSITLACLHPTM